MVRYSVLTGSEQLFASKYRLVLPSEEALRAELDRERARFDQLVQRRTELAGGAGSGDALPAAGKPPASHESFSAGAARPTARKKKT